MLLYCTYYFAAFLHASICLLHIHSCSVLADRQGSRCDSSAMAGPMGRRPLPAVRDLTRDGRWSTYDVSVLKKMGGGGRDANRQDTL
jgi:hypothetical protein